MDSYLDTFYHIYFFEREKSQLWYIHVYGKIKLEINEE